MLLNQHPFPGRLSLLDSDFQPNPLSLYFQYSPFPLSQLANLIPISRRNLTQQRKLTGASTTLFTHIWEYSPPSLTILVKLPMLLFWAGLSRVLEFILFTYQRRRYSSCLSLKQSSGDPSHQYTAVPQCLQGIGSRTVSRSYQNPWALKPLI